MIPGVAAEPVVTDWRALGEHVANLDSAVQAEFLMGFAQALSPQQVPWLADAITPLDTYTVVEDTIHHLAECLEHRKGATT